MPPVPAWLKLGAQALAIAAVGVLGALLVWNLTHQQPPPKVGKPAPAFALPKLDGKGELSLASFRGKTVVLNFFASWCEPCKQEAPQLEQVFRQYRSRGVVVLGVDSGDTRGSARQFLNAHGVTYPVVFDQNETLAYGRYALIGLPTTYVINPRGRIVGERVSGAVSDKVFAPTFRRELTAAMRS